MESKTFTVSTQEMCLVTEFKSIGTVFFNGFWNVKAMELARLKSSIGVWKIKNLKQK